MEKINRQRAPKGTATIRKKGNSYEARVTLALNSIMEGVDKNPRLSRTASSILENANILEVKYIDIPPKTYYKINEINLLKVLKNSVVDKMNN